MKEHLVVEWEDVVDAGLNRNQPDTVPTTHTAEIYNKSCQDRVRVALNVSDGKIIGAWAFGQGCVMSQGIAGLLCQHVIGLTLDECRQVDPVLDFEISPIRKKCAAMAVEALHAATNNPC